MHGSALVGIAALLLATSAKVDLRPLQPMVSLRLGACSVPVTFRLVIEARGDEDYRCPRVEWEWQDGTRSSEESDCPAVAAGSEVEPRQTWSRTREVRHGGTYTVRARLYKADRLLRTVKAQVMVNGEGMSSDMRRQMGCSP
jgi:hypothetical protein